jgi:hypothetical protein
MKQLWKEDMFIHDEAASLTSQAAFPLLSSPHLEDEDFKKKEFRGGGATS